MNAILKYQDSVLYSLSMKHTLKKGKHDFTPLLLYAPQSHSPSCDLL